MVFQKLLTKISLILFFLSSCSGDRLIATKGPEGDPTLALNFAQFNDIPIPEKSDLVKEDSIIISKKNGWLGRLVFDTSKEHLWVFDFFRNELPKFGWSKLSEIRSDSSLLNYTNKHRMASIQIFDNTWFGSQVSIIVSEIDDKLD